MRKLSHVLPEAIERREVLRAARAQRAVREWSEIVGPLLAERSQPDRYERGAIWISCTGAAWAHELRMLEPTILAKIAQRTGDPELVRELRFGVREPQPKPEGVHPRTKTPPDPELEHLSIREIADRRLKKWRDEEGA